MSSSRMKILANGFPESEKIWPPCPSGAILLRRRPCVQDPGQRAGGEGGHGEHWPEVITLFSFHVAINPLVPGVQKIKIRTLALNRLLIFEFVKKMVHHGAERQGLMG